ncbi:MAG TPA: 3-octaprenyl-4-hydroxybenzoate carboxy-lyase [Planctomycetaceae bacterium]|nr:3-octaprenyl-4-hydroxybenzoate carboxy-lyase [Planctomycetaceae bacterium]
MTYRSTRSLVQDLHRHGHLLVVDEEVDPKLELAEIHRRVYRRQGPALLFTNVLGSRFPVASNLFGTLERARFIFRHQIDAVRTAVKLKTDPRNALRSPLSLAKMPWVGWRMLPVRSRRPAVMRNSCRLSELPQVVCWPNDGGAFVTLPQVISQAPGSRGVNGLNLGMYRVQLSGNRYVPDRECGLHYQIHRGIGVHHAAAISHQADFPVNISVGGSPAMTLSAVMPLPEGMSELGFAGALAGHRIPLYLNSGQAPIYADADFCIVGRVVPESLKPEGPFGDHLGYYARIHDFPYLHVSAVYHRDDAVWPMTVVGRPPQEDTTFGQLIHEITEPVIPTVLPGVRQVHAVDAAGVHPLLLAVGSERYTPYQRNVRPQEILTQACAILGQGQLSLAKYLWIIDGLDRLAPAADDIPNFFAYVLQRVDWTHDLHFLTKTTIDTLDYSGSGLNHGSKLIVACGHEPRRTLGTEIPNELRLPSGWRLPHVALPGVLVIEALPHQDAQATTSLQVQCDGILPDSDMQGFPLMVVCDDSRFAARSLENFLWVAFTRSNPAVDIYGFGAEIRDKHFGCQGSLVIAARTKSHHAPGLIEDAAVCAKVDARATRNDPLARLL